MSLRSAIITPFNVFSALSFILLAGIALVVHYTDVNHEVLACIGAAGGFTFIAMFLVWTLFEKD